MNDQEKKPTPPINQGQTNPAEKASPNQPPQTRTHVAVRQESQIYYSGSLAHPDIVAGWEEQLPGSADRILQMAEFNNIAHVKINEEALRIRAKQVDRGQIFGFIVCMSGMVCATVLAVLGHAAAACLVGGGTLATLTAAFLRSGHK